MNTPEKPDYYWTDETLKLVSMTPADGWQAAFRYEDGTIYRTPLALWVMKRLQNVKRERPSGREINREDRTFEVVRGYYSGDQGLDDAEESSNFIGYFRETESDDEIRSVSDAQRPGAATVTGVQS